MRWRSRWRRKKTALTKKNPFQERGGSESRSLEEEKKKKKKKKMAL